MKFVKKFETELQFNNFTLDENNTPNVSLIEELYATGGIVYTSFIQSGHDYSQDYFTIEAIDNIDIILNYGLHFNDQDEEEPIGVMYYSINNGSTWNEMNNSVSLSAGDKIMFKGIPTTCLGSAGSSINITNGDNGMIEGRFNIEGNIMSLIYGDNFVGQTEFPQYSETVLWYYVFYGLFARQENLISAGNLILPVTTLVENCYSSMFSECTSLTTAPELPATTLVVGCYESMFYGCTSLNYIKCLATDISAEFCTDSWMYDVPASGTFIKAASMNDWTTGNSGIPSGWTIQDA